jgi:two-component system cell cycle response regulator CpdR
MAKILIAEDEDSLRRFVARALEMDGHQIVKPVTAPRRLSSFSQTVSICCFPISGCRSWMASRWQRQPRNSDCPGMPILLMTGYAEQRERAEPLMRSLWMWWKSRFPCRRSGRRLPNALSAQAA